MGGSEEHAVETARGSSPTHALVRHFIIAALAEKRSETDLFSGRISGVHFLVIPLHFFGLHAWCRVHPMPDHKQTEKNVLAKLFPGGLNYVE
jgi:hypothetical protein